MTRKPLLVTMSVMLVLVSALVVHVVLADGGLIRYSGSASVSVYEPAQKAIIAWNGTDETIILSVDVRADEDAGAIRVVPFPSNPIVKNASFDSFISVQGLIDSYVSSRARQFEREVSPWEARWAGSKGSSDVANATPSLTITFHEKIGPHNITVAKAENSSVLTQWITSLSKTTALSSRSNVLPEGFEQTLQEYIGNGFKFFALDLIELGPNQTSVEPLIYQFKTSFLYFPLKISSHTFGNAAINLFLATTLPIDEGFCTPFKMGRIQMSAHGYTTVEPLRFFVSKRNLKNIEPCIDAMFFGEACISALEWKGKLASLKTDFKADHLAFVLSSLIRALQLAFTYVIFLGIIVFVAFGLILCGGRRSQQEKGVNPFYPQDLA